MPASQKLQLQVQKKTGKNPTDRGKIGTKRSILCDAQGIPLSIVVAPANIVDHWLLKQTLDSIVIKRPDPKRVYQNLLADKEYGDQGSRRVAREYGYDAHIPQKINAKIKLLVRKLKSLGVDIKHENHQMITSVRKVKVEASGIVLN